MPLKHLLENSLAVALNHIPMTGDNLIEIPAVNLPDTAIKVRPIARTSRIPQEPLLPCRRSNSALKSDEESR